jgi:hypothetical protein
MITGTPLGNLELAAACLAINIGMGKTTIILAQSG